MKKLISIALCFVLLFSLAACKVSGGKTGDRIGQKINLDDTESTSSPEATSSQSGETVTSEASDPNAEVTVSVPLESIKEEYRDNLSLYAKEKGYISAEKNSDGTVTLKMKAMSYDLMKAAIGIDTMRELGKVLDSGDYPYFAEIGKYSDDFSEIVLLVKEKDYKRDSDSYELLEYVAKCGFYYQLYTGAQNVKCTVVIADQESHIIIDERIYTPGDIG